VLFNDGEGSVYSLNLTTGEEVWKQEGNIGTYTPAAGMYDPISNMFISLGNAYYEDKHCNPYITPGILPICSYGRGSRGAVWAYNATSGRLLWKTQTDEPPASVTALKPGNNVGGHLRIIVTMGMHCGQGSSRTIGAPSKLISLSPDTGHLRWFRELPTLWSYYCAGDKEGGDIRRAMGGRSSCRPNSNSIPAMDSNGDLYVGNQVGVLQKWGSPTGRTKDVQLLSSLETKAAFLDSAISFAPGIMAATTCTSLIVFVTE